MNNRKQMLKNLKNERKARREIEDNDNYIGRFIGTIFGVLVTLIITYLLVGIFFTKSIKFKKEDNKPVVTIDNETILLSNIFNQKENEYMVIIYDVNNENKSLDNWISYYKGKNSEATIYTVDSKNKMNAKYIVEENSNREASNLDELRVISPTVIKISEGRITEYYEGETSVKEMLKN